MKAKQLTEYLALAGVPDGVHRGDEPVAGHRWEVASLMPSQAWG